MLPHKTCVRKGWFGGKTSGFLDRRARRLARALCVSRVTGANPTLSAPGTISRAICGVGRRVHSGYVRLGTRPSFTLVRLASNPRAGPWSLTSWVSVRGWALNPRGRSISLVGEVLPRKTRVRKGWFGGKTSGFLDRRTRRLARALCVSRVTGANPRAGPWCLILAGHLRLRVHSGYVRLGTRPSFALVRLASNPRAG